MRTIYLILSVIFCAPCVFLQNQCPPNIYTQFDQTNCTSKATSEVSYYLEQRDTCLPHCVQFPLDPASERCDYDPCPPGYDCEHVCLRDKTIHCEKDSDCNTASSNREKCMYFCLAEEGGCMSYHAKTLDFQDTFWTAQKFKPQCDNDGKWKPKQCKGGLHGRCMCYAASGKRIFGEALRSEADDMTCACSRKKADLADSGRTYTSLHCASNGNYEKLQCDSGICWCADPQTGNPTAPVVPEKAMPKLPCYTKIDVGDQYLRLCESEEYALAKIKEKLKLHGVKFFLTKMLKCDADGAYGPFKIDDGNAYCTWRNNSNIKTWMGDVTAFLSILDCNCARDSVKYDHNMQCESYGNYKQQQTLIDDNNDFFYYCVDSDGFAKSDIMPLGPDPLDCSVYY